MDNKKIDSNNELLLNPIEDNPSQEEIDNSNNNNIQNETQKNNNNQPPSNQKEMQSLNNIPQKNLANIKNNEINNTNEQVEESEDDQHLKGIQEILSASPEDEEPYYDPEVIKKAHNKARREEQCGECCIFLCDVLKVVCCCVSCFFILAGGR